MQELRDSAEAKAIRPGGFELPALAVSNEDMAGFSRLGESRDRSSARDREQAMFGAGISLAQTGLDSIYGSAENKSDQVYLAANITPELPHIGQASSLTKDQQAPDKPITAQNYDYRGGFSTLVPSPEQLGLKPAIDVATQSAALELEQKWSPFRGNINAEMSKIPESTWHQAYEAFPQFKKAGLTEEQATEVMKAIVRNELYNYDAADKSTDDDVRNGQSPWLTKIHYKAEDKLTLGLAQLTTRAVHEREAEYPKQINFKGHEESALMQPENVPLLVAATLAHNVDMFNRHHIPVTEQSLAYSYNPPGGRILPSNKDLNQSVHAANVMHQLAIIRHQIEPKPGEN